LEIQVGFAVVVETFAKIHAEHFESKTELKYLFVTKDIETVELLINLK